MTLWKRLMAVPAAAFGLAFAAAAPVYATPYFQAPYSAAYAEPIGPPQLQDLLARTQTDLRGALAYATNGRQRDRAQNAERHLSDFDKRLTQGHWNHGDLNHAISNVQEVLKHNTLNASDRDRLQRDVEDLRVVRDRR